MNQVLVVEDSRLFGSLLKKKIDTDLNLDVVWAQTYTEAVNLINDKSNNFFVGLLDLNLPDAPDGKIVDFVLSKNIPVIVFTGEFSDDVREAIWEKKVVDYVIKESNHNLDYVVSLIRRIYPRPRRGPLLKTNNALKNLCLERSTTYQSSVNIFLLH